MKLNVGDAVQFTEPLVVEDITSEGRRIWLKGMPFAVDAELLEVVAREAREELET